MSGHSKWSKVKHQKAVTDAVKGSAFTKASRAITIAVREGGGVADPTMNFKLRLAVEKAKQVNMPKDTIERAIAKGKGEGGNILENIVYEGFGPHGVAFVIEATTDNRMRTVSSVKNILDRNGGSLGGPGAVAYLFRRLGICVVPKSSVKGYDEFLESALEAGADDVVEKDDVFEVYSTVQTLDQVKQKLESVGIPIEHTEIIHRPMTSVPVNDEQRRAVESLAESLEELEDVQNVYYNVD